jgi:predicted Zn-dependent protease
VEQLIDVAPDDQQFLASLLEQSLRAKLAPQSEAVLSRLEKLSPDDPEIARRKVQVLLLAKKTDEAVAVARALHEGPDGNETTAMVFAQAMADSAGTPERDQWMARLQAEYPGNLEILAKFAIYLSRSKRTAAAVAMLNLAFDKATSKKAKDSIAHLAIAVPMAVEEADLAEAQLIRHAGSLPTSLWTLSFEGRIALMRKNLDEAEKKFKQVVNSPDARKPENLPVTRQSFVWLQRVRGQKLKAESGKTDAEPPEKPAPAGTKPTDDEGLLVPESSS